MVVLQNTLEPSLPTGSPPASFSYVTDDGGDGFMGCAMLRTVAQAKAQTQAQAKANPSSSIATTTVTTTHENDEQYDDDDRHYRRVDASSLWDDVRMASAWFDRALKIATTAAIAPGGGAPPSSVPTAVDDDELARGDAAACARNALGTYRRCFRLVRRLAEARAEEEADATTTIATGVVGTPAASSCDAATTGGADETNPDVMNAMESKLIDNFDGGGGSGRSEGKNVRGGDLRSECKGIGREATEIVNLELRIAQAFRLLAHIEYDGAPLPSSTSRSSPPPSPFRGRGRCIEAAINHHDDAVSFLVGLFDEGEEGEGFGDTFEGEDEVGIGSKVEREGESVTPSSHPVEKADPADSLVLLTIRVPDDDYDRSDPVDSRDRRRIICAVSFIAPDENQRVRAIAASLNAMAALHGRRGNDGAAMDAYREALEILRAATEAEEEAEAEAAAAKERGDCGESGDRIYYRGETPLGGGTGGESGGDGPLTPSSPRDCRRHRGSGDGNDDLDPSGPEADLAATLVNLGNFHLSRCFLDAALDAYSAAWALRSVRKTSADRADDDGGGHDGDNVSVAAATAVAGAAENSSGALAVLNNMGVVHERRGDLDKALACHDRIRRAKVDVLGPDHPDAADSWNNTGNVLQRMGDWEGAAEAHTEAARIYRGAVAVAVAGTATSPSPLSDLFHRLSGALRNRGTVRWKQGRIPEAIDLFREAIDAKRSVVAAAAAGGRECEGEGRRAREAVAQMLGVLGCLHVEHPKVEPASFDAARGSFEDALRIYGELGYVESDSAVAWNRRNLEIATNMTEQCRRTPINKSDTHVKAEGVDASADVVVVDGCSSVFSGVEGNGRGSDVASSPEPAMKKRTLQARDKDAGRTSKDGSFAEEVDFDEYVGAMPVVTSETNEARPLSHVIESEKNPANKPLTNEQQSNSVSLLSEHDQQENANAADKELGACYEFLCTQKVQHGPDSLEVADALVAFAVLHKQRNALGRATDLYNDALSVFELNLGDSDEVASTMKALGDLNKESGKLEAAKVFYTKSLEMEKVVHGQYSPQTLNATGVLCLQEDDFRSAMEYHRRALQIQKKSLGEENKYEMYETLVRIGNVYYKERNNLTNIRSKGVDYKEFIESGFLGWIANAHDLRGEYSMAIQFYEESLQIANSRENRESKSEMALTLNRLGSLNRELGRYIEAMDYHQRALHLQQATSSMAKAMTAETCVLMGMVRYKMGEYRRALDLYEDAFLVLKSTLGSEHFSVAKTLTQMGAVRLDLCDYEKAMEMLKEAERYQLASPAVGGRNRDTLETQALIGRLLSLTGEFDNAIEMLCSVAEKQSSLFGVNHPSIAETKQYIAECLLSQGKLDEALSMYVNSYKMRKRFFSMEQIQVAESLVDVIRTRNGPPKRALAIYSAAMKVYKEYLPSEHVQIGLLLIYEGDAYAELLNFSFATSRYDQAMEIFDKAVGKNHVVKADILVNIGKVLVRKCEYDEAKEKMHTALGIYKAKLSENHPKISSTLNHLDGIEKDEVLIV